MGWLSQFCQGKGLDVGVGGRKIHPQAIGIDVSLAQGRTPDVMAPAWWLPFPDNSMDYVVSCHLLEHVADTKAALKEFWRVLRVDGICAAFMPDGERGNYSLYTLEHVSGFTPKILNRFFQACGFDVFDETEMKEGNAGLCIGIAGRKAERQPRHKPDWDIYAIK